MFAQIGFGLFAEGSALVEGLGGAMGGEILTDHLRKPVSSDLAGHVYRPSRLTRLYPREFRPL